MTLGKMMLAATLGTLTLAALPATASAQDRWDWSGGRRGDRDILLVGQGVRDLDPALRETGRGRAFVIRNFDANDDGRINRREAAEANIAFARIAGRDRGRFDWDARDRVVAVPVAVHADGGWDRRGMRDYGMRQTRYGAMFTLQDVLFRTGSAELRPGAADRLRPLAGYLRTHRAIRVRIDGHTDSVGTTVANRSLSERRAATVRLALADMGVDRARFRVQGFGETAPVATNATPAGRQRNRRVEVTLIGQQARSFDYRD
ncbi:MAG TPA: OmpA family protein [Sphingomonas sp.]|jgi:outer membrane protein OmpA-like peptidoglycan-associated protein|uniref:OmpA family protein n=1 Tax=Sphingomonas sp. TaxID=28214 RepID=UPI002EDA6624